MRRRQTRAPVLPPGEHFALTYEIPDNFGGLTKAMLQRSWNIESVTGTPVTVLTVGHQPELSDVRADLVRRGLLRSPSSLVNLWEDLADADSAHLRLLGADPAMAYDAPRDASFVDADIHRPDGSLLARQRWIKGGLRAPAARHGDAVIGTWIWDRDGDFVGGVPGTWSLWRRWVAERVAGAPANVIIDSATVADAFATAGLPDVALTVVVHNSHLDASVDPPYGPLGRWRKFLLDHRSGFDAVVFLTDRQRRDAELLLGPMDNAHTVPNALSDASPVRQAARDGRRGIVLASLDDRKRLDHAIRAVARIGDTHLHVFGSGPRREDLQDLIATSDAPVTLEGQTTDPATELARSSYLLLTSTKEGLPLVLAEAMREGCVPIAYDIPYGPSDVVVDGVNGLLVPAGDVKALASTVQQLLRLSPRRDRAMRKAARRSARTFEPTAIVHRWAAVLSDADHHRASRSSNAGPTDDLRGDEHRAMVVRFGEPRLAARLRSVEWGPGEVTLDLAVQVQHGPLLDDVDTEPVDVAAEVVHRPSGRRAPLTATPTAGGVRVTASTSLLEQPLDHLFLLTARALDLELVATVLEPEVYAPWPSAPPVDAGGPRPALEIVDRVGLQLVTAQPVVVGTAEVRPEPTVRAWAAAGRPVTRLELSAPGQETRIVEADEGEASIGLLPPARWRVRGELDGRWRDVAWAPDPSAVPGSSTDLTRVRLTPRGYLRLETRTSAATLESVEGTVLAGTCSGPHAPMVGGVAAQREQDRWRLPLDTVPLGRHRLLVDDEDVEASASLQALLPATIDTVDRTVTVRRRGRRNAYEVAVEPRRHDR